MRLGIMLFVSFIAAGASAESVFVNQKVLGRNTITGTIDSAKLVCYEGIAPNGHNYPVSSRLSIENRFLKVTKDGNEFSGIYGSNIKEFGHSLNQYDCRVFGINVQTKDFWGKFVTKGDSADPSKNKSFPFVAEQVLFEVAQKRGDGLCQKHFIEDVTITVNGMKLYGRKEMQAFPIEASNCQADKK